MKTSRKLLSVLLALVMVLALATTAFAAQGMNDNSGKITINNAIAGQNYSIYQILSLESYNTESGSYSYKATSEWAGFVTSEDIAEVYLHTDTNGYVTWVGDQTDARAAEFAKLAKKYAANNSIAATDTAEAQGTAGQTVTVKFEDLNLGYYLMDSDLGVLCSLDTTAKEVTISEKNEAPTNEKEVAEDSNNGDGKVNDADIGDTVTFKSTITAQEGAENYVFHDKMDSGLTFKGILSITLGSETVAAENYTLVTTGLTDDCTFEVSFTQAFCDTLKDNDEIVITYQATLNENAVIGGAGNGNESKVSYGEEGHTKFTPGSTTKTYTWEFDVLKYGNGDTTKVLKDAEFVLLNSDNSKVATVVNGKLTGWVDVPAADTDGNIVWPGNTKLITGDDGKFAVQGLDADTYYLREIKAPDGYNKLAEDREVVISATTSEDGKTMTQTTANVQIENKSGTELPSTGGIGTTIFYIVGAILVLGAGVLLVTRKRTAKR